MGYRLLSGMRSKQQLQVEQKYAPSLQRRDTQVHRTLVSGLPGMPRSRRAGDKCWAACRMPRLWLLLLLWGAAAALPLNHLAGPSSGVSRPAWPRASPSSGSSCSACLAMPMDSPASPQPSMCRTGHRAELHSVPWLPSGTVVSNRPLILGHRQLS